MLSRHGIVVIAAGVAALVIGRVFAIVELFVIAVACIAAPIVALLYVRLRRPRLEASRWIHPSVLVAGDTGRVDLHLRHLGVTRSAPFTLREGVARTMSNQYVARLSVDPMAGGFTTTTGYSLPSAVRGVIVLGPLEVELRDPLGLARSVAIVAGADEVVVSPRAHLLDMPQLGQGALGNALLAKAQRLGPGEFHGLREYADGDEPRSIHWKASARTDSLMVREHAVEGLHRCTVVFDAAPGAHCDDDAFERGVTAAASLVHSATRGGLTTRFVTNGGIDLRGPDVAAHALRVLARIEPSDDGMPIIDRESGEGLGLVVVITGSPNGPAWRSAKSIADPTLTTLLIATDGDPPGRQRSGSLTVSARSETIFVASWQALAGRGRIDLLA